jgi:hypothetical protein
MAAALALACSAPQASRAPLSPPAAEPEPTQRPSSSRSSEGAGEHQRTEVELGARSSGGGDDDDDTSRRAACPPAPGAPPDCSLLPAERSCLGAALARRACESVGPALDPRVGAAWLECLREREPGSDPCDSHRIVACGLRAVQGACVEEAFHAECEAIARGCADVAPEITAPVCEKLLGAWKPDHRSKIIDCLTQGCESGGFGACLP